MDAKRVCTQELRDATRDLSPRRVISLMGDVSLYLTRRNSAAILGDELFNALQSVGSRVRKSTLLLHIAGCVDAFANSHDLQCADVNEGYATSRFTTPNASPIRPLVPNPSPIGRTDASPIPAPIFSSVSDTLRMVYGDNLSPQASPNPSPSRPTKRARVIEDENVECHDRIHSSFTPRSALFSTNFGEDDLMDTGDDVDDDMVMDAPTFPPIKSFRRITPLKRSTRSMPAKENIQGSVDASPVDRPKPEAWQAADISKFAKLTPD